MLLCYEQFIPAKEDWLIFQINSTQNSGKNSSKLQNMQKYRCWWHSLYLGKQLASKEISENLIV